MRLLVVDDRRPSAEALCLVLAEDPEIEICETCPDHDSVLPLVGDGRFDVIVLSGDGGIEGAAAVREVDGDIRIVLVTSELRPEVLAAAVNAEVDALLSNDAPLDDLRDAVLGREASDRAASRLLASVAEQVRRGDVRTVGPPIDLTPREREVLEPLSQGTLVKDIAQELGIQTETCRGYVKTLLMKLDARSQLQAVVIAGRLGLLGEEPSFG